MMKMMAAFAVGVVAGLAVTWAYVLSLKATIRVCVSYIHDRLDQHVLALQESQLCNGGSMKDRRNVFSTTTEPQQRQQTA